MTEGLGHIPGGGENRSPRCLECVADVGDLLIQLLRRGASALDQQCGGLLVLGQVGQLGTQRDHFSVLGGESERAAVKDLDSVNARVLAQRRGRVARLPDITEDKESGRFVRMVGDGLVGDA